MACARVERFAWLPVALAAVSPVLCQTPAGPVVRALDDRPVAALGAVSDAPATVFVFTATDCPIANRYAPELNRLQSRFAARGVRFHLVYANPRETAETVRTHLTAFAHDMTALRDPAHELVRFAHVTVAPEAAVYDRQGRQVYRGRIDDRFPSLGVDRQVPKHRDLEEALEAVLDGRPVTSPVTPAVGCFLSDFTP
jgi:hypothetical protein